MDHFGEIFRLTTFGESHSTALGGVIEGCPSGVALDMELLHLDLQRRRGNRGDTTARNEQDHIEFLSGIFEGRTLGTPIAFLIRNTDARSADYEQYRNLYRPGHGDYTWQQKFGLRDHRGGGRSSARETVCRVVAGAIAKQILLAHGITLHAEVDTIGGRKDYASLLEQCAAQGDTIGGTISLTIEGLKAGQAGSPIFGKLQSQLAAALFSIPSVVGVETGFGFESASMLGSQYIDHWQPDFTTSTNHCGGIQGGISNGMPVTLRVAFHPVVTLPQGTPCISPQGEIQHVVPGGRHDRCQVLRAPVIVEAMAALTLINNIL